MQKSTDKTPDKNPDRDLPRLQKVLAAAGVASRRACEALIVEGHVKVNSTTVRELGTKVDPDKDDIRVDNEKITAPQEAKLVYVMLNKPIGYTSTVSDPHAQRTVLELLLQVEERVFPVGRLDVDSEGLLILTNDGDFANRLTHPRYHVPKIYRVRAKGFVGRAAATRLAEGLELEDGKTAPTEVRYIEYDEPSQSTTVEITLYEGRNRQVRRMFDAVGNPVRQLTRIAFGNLRLGGLNPGTWRKLRPDEVEALLELATPTPTPPKSARRPKPMGTFHSSAYTKRPARTRASEAAQAPTEALPDAIPATPPVAPPAMNRFSEAKQSGSKPQNAGHPNTKYPNTKYPNTKQKGTSHPQGAHGKFSRPYSNSGRQSEREDQDERVQYNSQPARAATPFEKRIAKAARSKSLKQGAESPQAGSAKPTYQAGSGRDSAQRLGRMPGVNRPHEDSEFGRSKQPSPRPRPAQYLPPTPPTAAPDGSMNNAAGRKAGIPYVPRPKTGFRKFGRSRP